MTVGIRRYVSGERVDVRRDKVGASNTVVADWKRGATFSHYNRKGYAVVQWPDGSQESLPDGTRLRTAE